MRKRGMRWQGNEVVGNEEAEIEKGNCQRMRGQELKSRE